MCVNLPSPSACKDVALMTETLLEAVAAIAMVVSQCLPLNRHTEGGNGQYRGTRLIKASADEATAGRAFAASDDF